MSNKAFYAIFLALFLYGCAGVTTDIMIGTKLADGGFYGPTGPVFTLRVKKPMTERTWCAYEHISHVFAGPPFGPRNEEDALDQFGCGITFGD